MDIYVDCCTQAGTSCVCIHIYHDVVGVHFPHFMALACFVLFGFMFGLVCRKKPGVLSVVLPLLVFI